jgi:dTDP-4-dehydrorhamnose reductase
VSFLLIGGDSEIAGATLTVLRRDGLPVVATTRRRDTPGGGRVFLDLTAPLEGWRPPEGTNACCIFAAVAHLPDCARDPEGSSRVNVAGTIALVERLVTQGVYVLYLSTDKVFDGNRPLMPADAPLAPRSEYGRQKARTDAHLQAMIARRAPVGILRLARVLSPGMPLLRQWQQALAAAEVTHPFDDMMMAPSLAADVAATIVALLASREPGICQLSGARDMSYADVARFIARRIGADPRLVEPVPAASAGMPEGAVPRHTTLDSRAVARFGICPRDPLDVVAAVLNLPRSPPRP